MSSLFFGSKDSKPSSSSRLSPRGPTDKGAAKPPVGSRGAVPAVKMSSSIEERVATLRQKNPASFQQVTPPSSRTSRQPAAAADQTGGVDMDEVTAWQSDMASLEQTQDQIQNEQMNLLHSQIHILTRELGDLQKHVVNLTQKLEEDLSMHAQTHSASLAELEEKLQNDLASVADDHAKALAGLNDEHNEKHAQNAEAVESSLQSVLESTHGKLQEELQELRHGGAGSLKDMGKILGDVTEEVDKINQALEKEHELRLAVEEKLDRMCGELQEELQLSFQESHAALKLELAEVSGNADDIKSAMQSAHSALKREFESHVQENGRKTREMTEAINSVNEEHHEKHAQNAQALEANLHATLGGAHAKLQEEMKLLKSGGAANVEQLQKILADVTAQVDTLDQAMEQEQELRVAVEARVDQMFSEQEKVIGDLRKDMKVALNESHSALKLELAEHGKNADEIKAAMDEANEALREESKLAHGSLKNELSSLAKNNDALHKQTLSELNKVHEEHSEKHIQNNEKLEAGIENVLGSTHAKLQEELKVLKSGGVGSLKDLQKILADVTKQVDNLDQAMEQEHELRMAVEEKVDKLFADQDKNIGDLRKDMKVALNESHAALKLELADHGKNAEEIKAAMEEANAALKEETKLAHGSLKNELSSLSKSNDAMHKKTQEELKKEMQAMSDSHHEIHAQNSQKLEAGLESVLGNTHAKLQDELKMLRSGGVGSLSDLQKVLADVTQQVDNLDQAVEKEHELRMAVEVKLDAMFNDQDKNISDLRKDMKVALNEAHAALKLEMAEHGKNADEIKAAMEEANAALKNEAQLAHGSLKKEMQSLSKSNDALHAKTQADLRKEMEAIHEEHSERHAANAEKLESGLESVLGNTHAKLQEELKLLKSGGVGSLTDLQKILTDVTQQVDNLDKAVEKEHDLRMAVEAKLDSMFSDQDKNISDLRKDMKVALNEAHAALKLEMAEHGKNANEIRAAMEEANAALKNEAQLAHGSLKNEMAALSKSNDALHAKTQAELRKEMEAIHDEHSERHAQNAEKLESGLETVLGNTHAKLQEELKLLKSGGVGSLTDLQKILTDVTQQVDNLDKAVEQEHGLRMAVEVKLDSMFNDQDKIITDLRKDMKVALNESHAALKLELAEHGKNANEIKAAMEEANAALKNEAKLAHGSLKNEMSALSKNTDALHARSQAELRREMKEIHDSHSEKHVQNAERLEAGLQSVLGNTHQKLQEEMKLLKSGGVGSLKDLQKILADVTQQVDNLDRAMQQEHELRMNVESKMDKIFVDQDKSLRELRQDMKVALNESHAALKLELAEHGKNAGAIQKATEEAYRALQGETKLAHGSLKNELSSLSKGNSNRHKQTLDELQKTIHTVNAEHHEKHAITAERLESGLQSLKVAVYETQQALKAERTNRDFQDRTFMEFFQDARQQKDAAEQAFGEQLRLERVAREVQANQLKDAVTHAAHFQPNIEYTDLLLQERASRESGFAVMERRLEAFDRNLSLERHERSTELMRLWDVFDGHTHEALSQVPPKVRQAPLSPRTSIRPTFVETVRQPLMEQLPVTERVISYAPSVEAAVTVPTVTRSPSLTTRIVPDGVTAFPVPLPTTIPRVSLPATGGGSVTLSAAPSI